MSEIPVGLCRCGCGGQTSISKYTRHNLGHVKGQPVPYVQGHGGRKLAVRERFEQYVYPDPNSGCFIWAGTTRPDGYGQFSVNRRMRRAHHVAWAMAGCGPIPRGMDLCHKCHTRCCVNPDHLYVGSREDNMNDTIRDLRFWRSKRFPYGVSRQSRSDDRYKAGVMFRGKRLHLGTFTTIEAAARAAEDKRLELRGKPRG